MFFVILKNKKLLLYSNIAIVLIGLILCYVLPQKFTATGVFIRESHKGTLSNGLNMGIGLFMSMEQTEINLYDIITTRWIMDKVIKQENLMAYYKAKVPEEAYAKYIKNMELEDKMNGMYIIRYTDKDPAKASSICNTIMYNVDDFYKYKDSTYAADYLVFLDNVMQDVKKDIEKTKDSIVVLSKKSGIWVDPNTVNSTVMSLNEGIRDSIVQKEMMYRYYKLKNPNSSLTKGYKKEMDALYKVWDNIYTKGVMTNKNNPIVTPLGEVPEVLISILSLQSVLAVKTDVYALLSREYYSNLFKKKKESHNIQIIDNAVPPNKRSFPKRKILLLGFIFIALLWDVIFIQYKLGNK